MNFSAEKVQEIVEEKEAEYKKLEEEYWFLKEELEDLDKENSAFSPYGLMMSNNRNFGGKTYVKYDYVYTKLSKNLDKEVSRQD